MLKAAGLYRTVARVAVLGVLLEAEGPLRRDQIAGRLGEKRLDKVTIYRTLRSLERIDLVHRAYVKARTWHFELARNCTQTQCHPHFTCTNCGRVHCLTEMRVPRIGPRHKGFLIQRRQIRLEGLCPACVQGRPGGEAPILMPPGRNNR